MRRDLVGLEALDRIDEFLAVHRRDQRLADRVVHLDQDLAVTVRLDAVPDDQPVVERQRLEDVGDVGRMQPVEDRTQLAQVLAMHQLLDQRLLLRRPASARDGPGPRRGAASRARAGRARARAARPRGRAPERRVARRGPAVRARSRVLPRAARGPARGRSPSQRRRAQRAARHDAVQRLRGL